MPVGPRKNGRCRAHEIKIYETSGHSRTRRDYALSDPLHVRKCMEVQERYVRFASIQTRIE
jgi:hypothetical protein